MANGKRVTVCGVKVLVTSRSTYGGGHIAPTARYLGQVGKIGKSSAKKLTTTLGIGRLPKPGYEMTLCEGVKLGNRSGRFELVTNPRMLDGYYSLRRQRRR